METKARGGNILKKKEKKKGGGRRGGYRFAFQYIFPLPIRCDNSNSEGEPKKKKKKGGEDGGSVRLGSGRIAFFILLFPEKEFGSKKKCDKRRGGRKRKKRNEGARRCDGAVFPSLLFYF